MAASQVTAFCPGHISGFFKPVLTGDIITSGSTGGGVVINSGVTVTVKRTDSSSVRVFREEQIQEPPVLISTDSPVIMQLLKNLEVTAAVDTRCNLPLSAGYGLSAASLLASAHAINTLFSLNLSDKECAAHAHGVEVKFRTGLGDVSACQGGGWVFRKTAGIGADIIRHQDKRTIYALTLGPLKTVSVLSSQDRMDQICSSFPEGEPRDLDDLFRFSRKFAEAAGLITDEIRKVLIACDTNDIPVSMTMLGSGVFALGDKAKEILSRFGPVYPLQIAEEGPRILEIIP